MMSSCIIISFSVGESEYFRRNSSLEQAHIYFQGNPGCWTNGLLVQWDIFQTTGAL